MNIHLHGDPSLTLCLRSHRAEVNRFHFLSFDRILRLFPLSVLFEAVRRDYIEDIDLVSHGEVERRLVFQFFPGSFDQLVL